MPALALLCNSSVAAAAGPGFAPTTYASMYSPFSFLWTYTDGPCPARSALCPDDSQPFPFFSPPKQVPPCLSPPCLLSLLNSPPGPLRHQESNASALCRLPLPRRDGPRQARANAQTPISTPHVSLTPPRSLLSACGWAVFAVNSVVSSRFVPESSQPRSSNSTDDAFQALTLYPHRISHFCPHSSSRSSSLNRHCLQAAPCCPPWASQARPLRPPPPVVTTHN